MTSRLLKYFPLLLFCAIPLAIDWNRDTAANVFLFLLAGVLIVAFIAEFLIRSERSWRFWSILAGISGGSLCLLNLILFRKQGVDVFFWLAVGATGASLLILFFPRLLRCLRSVCVPIAILNLAILALLSYHALANLGTYAMPDRFETRPERTAAQARDMEELERLIARNEREDYRILEIQKLRKAVDEIQTKLSISLTPDELRQTNLSPVAEDLARLQPSLDDFFSFLSTHQPVSALQLAADGGFQESLAISAYPAVQLELISIWSEAKAGRDVTPRLHRLLQSINTIMGLDVGFVMSDALSAYAAVDHVAGMSKFLERPDPQLVELLDSNRQAVRQAFRKSIISSMKIQREMLRAQELCLQPDGSFTLAEAFQQGSRRTLEELLIKRRARWPFFNLNETEHRLAKSQSDLLAAFDETSLPARLGRFQELEDQANQEIETLNSLRFFRRNLLGRWGHLFGVSQIPYCFQQALVLETKIAATEQLLRKKWGMAEPPVINPLTEKPFKFSANGTIDVIADLPPELREKFDSLATVSL